MLLYRIYLSREVGRSGREQLLNVMSAAAGIGTRSMIKSEISKKRIIFLTLLIFSFTCMLYYGSLKEGYHVDEVYSYGLANSEYLPFMHFGAHDYNVKDWMMEYGAGESFGDLFKNLWKDFQILKECDFQWRDSVIYRDYLTAQANSADTRTSTWLSGQAYRDYVAVSESNTFNYASVYYNQRGDVHPPLYYLILHTICSFFPGVFSPWFALSLNILFLLLMMVVMYRMIKVHLGGETTALVTVAVIGLCCGTMTTAMYLRMYALMTLMTSACCLVHLKAIADGFQWKGKNGVLLVLTVIGGYMTHYYFVLYAIGIAAVSVVVMAVRKKWRSLLRYILLLTCAAAIGLCIWPFSVKHVFFGYRGYAAIGTLSTGDFYLIRLRLMLQQIAAQVLGGQGYVLWLVAAVVIGVCLWKRGRNLPIIKGAVVFFPILFYVVVVSQIVPFFAERYVMCAFPFACLFMTTGIAFCLKSLMGSLEGRWFNRGMAAAGIMILLLNNAYLHTPAYLYRGGQETVVLPADTDCIYVLPDGDWNESAIDSTILAQCRNVAVAYHSSLPGLAEGYQYPPGGTVMVAIQKEMDVEEVLLEVKTLFHIEELTEIERQQGDVAVRILLSRGEISME